MFKMGLLVSTAMTAVTLLLPGAPPGAYARTDMHVANRDANTRFLCTYGQIKVFEDSDFGGGSSVYSSGWSHVAVPITGRGQTVSRIKVIEAEGTFSFQHSAFSIGIYSNAPSGFPGKLIAGGTGRTGRTCGPVRISISPTTLQPKTKYWLEETVRPASFHASSFYWYADPNTKRKAYVQYHRRYYDSENSSMNSSYTSPWTEQTKGPYFKLR